MVVGWCAARSDEERSHWGTLSENLPTSDSNRPCSSQSEWQGPGLSSRSLTLYLEVLRVSWGPLEIHIREYIISSSLHRSFDPQ